MGIMDGTRRRGIWIVSAGQWQARLPWWLWMAWWLAIMWSPWLLAVAASWMLRALSLRPQ